jgi:ferredoxin
MVRMIARYNGICSLCHARVGAGTPILWSKHTKDVIHAEEAACERLIGSEPARVSTVTPAEEDRLDKLAYAEQERLAEQYAYSHEMELEAHREWMWEQENERWGIY